MNRSYLEASDDEQYDSINIRALKKGHDDEMDDYGDSDSDDDYGTFAKQRGRKRTRKQEEESDEDEEEMVFDDDDEEEVQMHKGAGKKAQKPNAAVLDDEEE